jgi:iron complex outermembrane receptor protein
MPHFRSALAAACSLVAVAGATAAIANPRQFAIDAQPAAEGVRQFARQAGVEIISPAAVVANKRVNRVVGRMDVDAALGEMLRGTDIRSSRAPGGAIVLSMLQASAPAAPARSAGQETAPIEASVAAVPPAVATEPRSEAERWPRAA